MNIDNQLINYLVDAIIIKNGKRDFNLPSYNKKKYTTIGETKEEEYKDESREIKGICTDIIVNDFLKSTSNVFNFMKVIYDTFDNAIKLYINKKNLPKEDVSKGYPGSIFFVCKGGNILRIVSNEFEKEYPGIVVDDLIQYYKQFFKRSDADFSIYIDPIIGDKYEEVFFEMTLLAYLLQFIIRIHFLNDLPNQFDYFSYSDEFKIETLEKYLNKMNEANVLVDPENKTFYGGKFTKLLFQNPVVNNVGLDSPINSGKQDIRIQKMENTNDTVLINIYKKPFIFYISSNETLDFIQGSVRTKFNLVRTKVNFIVYLNKNDEEIKHAIGGELIDVSIPHKDTTDFNHIFMNIDKAIKKYDMVFKDKRLTFRAYSIENLIEDLELILFINSEKPWDDNKYAKRINRLFYMYLIDILSKISNQYEAIKLINNFNTLIIEPIYNQINISNKNIYLNKINEISKNNIKQFNSMYYRRKYFLNKFIIYLEKISKTSFDEKEEFKKFMELIKENIIQYNKIFPEIQKFINSKGKFDEENVYKDITIESLAGGYKKY